MQTSANFGIDDPDEMPQKSDISPGSALFLKTLY